VHDYDAFSFIEFLLRLDQRRHWENNRPKLAYIFGDSAHASLIIYVQAYNSALPYSVYTVQLVPLLFYRHRETAFA